MFVLRFIVADVGNMRPLLLILLMLAILFLLAGAILAVIALRNQRRGKANGIGLEQLESEAGQAGIYE